MGRYDELPVYKASYDLLLEIFRFTKNFNKEFKYTVGESLKKETTELITLIYRANSKRESKKMKAITRITPAGGQVNSGVNPRNNTIIHYVMQEKQRKGQTYKLLHKKS